MTVWPRLRRERWRVVYREVVPSVRDRLDQPLPEFRLRFGSARDLRWIHDRWYRNVLVVLERGERSGRLRARRAWTDALAAAPAELLLAPRTGALDVPLDADARLVERTEWPSPVERDLGMAPVHLRGDGILRYIDRQLARPIRLVVEDADGTRVVIVVRA